MRPPVLLTLLFLAACKPPATDGFAERQQRGPIVKGPSDPQESPETSDAIWSQSATELRLIYGNPGEPPLLALACDTSSDPQQLRLTRFALADEGAQAFLALIGNGHVARVPVDAVETPQGFVWQGYADPSDRRMEVFSGARAVTATVPGAGTVTLNASALTAELLEQCEATPEPDAETQPSQ